MIWLWRRQHGLSWSYLWDRLARRRESQGRDQVCDVLPNHILPRREPMKVSKEIIAGCDSSLEKRPHCKCYNKSVTLLSSVAKFQCLQAKSKAVFMASQIRSARGTHTCSGTVWSPSCTRRANRWALSRAAQMPRPHPGSSGHPDYSGYS